MNRAELQRWAPKAAELRKRVEKHLLKTRGDKYREWLQALQAGRSFLQSGLPFLQDPFFKRAADQLEIIDTLYALMRMVDDYVDGDAMLPAPWKSSVEYVESLLRVERPIHEMGQLLDYVVALGDELGMDLRPGIRDVMRSMHFDAKRREALNAPVILTAVELKANYDLLDSEGTIGLCLLILGESHESFADICLLGEATRIMYTLRDLVPDIRAKLYNFPREAVPRYGMYVPNYSIVEDVWNWYHSKPVQAWRRDEAERGLKLFEQYEQKREHLKVHSFTRMVLEFLYERSTRAGLEQALRAA